MAPRVGIVANMQANLVIELLYKKSFFVPNRCPDIFLLLTGRYWLNIMGSVSA